MGKEQGKNFSVEDGFANIDPRLSFLTNAIFVMAGTAQKGELILSSDDLHGLCYQLEDIKSQFEKLKDAYYQDCGEACNCQHKADSI